jgi:hypothetical protein
VPTEERRKDNDKHWNDFYQFMMESREYRATDIVTQKYQAENLASLVEQVKKQNGRVFELEIWQREVKDRIKNRREEIDSNIKFQKDSKNNKEHLIMIICTVIMAVSAIVMIFKHGK